MKHVLLALLVSVLVWGSEHTITALTGEKASVEGEALVVGKSGLVLRQNGSDAFIVSGCEAIGEHEIKLTPYTNLQQEAIPTLAEKPKVGDKLHFGVYDSRKLLIAPNQTAYMSVIGNDATNYIHPDLFAMILHDKGEPNPKKAHFEQFCHLYSVSTLSFMIEDKLYDVDCLSFKILQTQSATTNNEPKITPFFSRFERFNKGLFNFEETMKDYTTYYKALLEIK